MSHQCTVPSDALEGLVKAYITMWIIADFFRELAAGLEDRDAVDAVLADIGQDAANADRVSAAVAADPRRAARLALRARRVLGAALARATDHLADSHK